MSLKIHALMFTAFLQCLFGKPTSADAQPINLAAENWQFTTDDKPEFAKRKFVDSTWRQIPVGQAWEKTVGNFDGVGWYRKTLVLDSKTYRKTTEKGGGLVLRLGKIDDADETFFNGKRIGATGEFPPKSVSAWDVNRVYIIPKKLIRWDKPNVIAIRVADWGGGGGLYAGDVFIEPMTWKERLKIIIENVEITNAFAFGAPVALGISLENGAKEDIGGTLTTEIQTFSGEKIREDSRRLQVLSDKNLTLPPFFFPNLPKGFYHTVVRFEDEKRNVLTVQDGFAVAPTEAISPAAPPADFDAFWQAARAELDSVKPDFTLIPSPQYSTEKVEVFEVEMHSLGNVRVRGYYAQPREKTNLPPILHVQGYSSVMLPFDLDTSFAQFFLNIRGHGNSRSDVNPGFPGFLLDGIGAPQTYIYRGAYMDCVRAVDFLASRAEVDLSRLAVEGASQGGALSVATAALDKRVKFCLPDVPFLSDFRNYFQIAGWPANEFRLYGATHFRKMDSIFGVLDYFDIRNLAPSVNIPVLMGVGLKDQTCPPAINFAMFNNLATKEKTFRLYPTAGHALPPTHYNVKKKWLIGQLGL